MEIEFYFKLTGEVIEKSDDYYFVMNNRVYRDNNLTTESQEASVCFDDFITRQDSVDWRIKPSFN